MTLKKTLYFHYEHCYCGWAVEVCVEVGLAAVWLSSFKAFLMFQAVSVIMFF